MARTLSAIKLLRHAVVDAIKSADIEGIGDNVFEARKENAWPEEGCFVVVYTDSSKFDDKRTSPKTYFSSTDVTVDVVCQGLDDADESLNDKLDDLTIALINVLQPPMPKEGFFGGLTKRFVLTSIDNNLSEAGEMNRGCQRIVFNTEFNVTITQGGPSDDFLKSKNSIAMGEGEENTQSFVTDMRPQNA